VADAELIHRAWMAFPGLLLLRGRLGRYGAARK